MFAHRSTIGSTVSAFSGGNIGTTRATPHLSQALHPVKILAEAEQGDFDGCGITAGLPRHLPEFRQNLGEIATSCWNPAIAIADCAPGAIREGAADMDGGCGFCTGLGWRSSDRSGRTPRWYSASGFVQISFIASMDFAHSA